MKFYKLFLAFFLGAFTVSAQTYMPDDNFESWCEASGYGDGILGNDFISSSAASFPTLLAIDNVGISDLTGLEAFTSLTILNCANNYLSNIDISFLGNQLTIFNATNNNTDLYCITVFDTAYAANHSGFFEDSITSYSTNCLIGFGCIDSFACNYDPLANIDDGSCDYSCLGCANPSPTGAYTSELIHDRARINWDNMNDSNCMVDQYRIRYREVGTSAWSTKTMSGSGLCVFGLNTTSKILLGLLPSTTYEYRMKAWYCGGGVSSWTADQNFTTLDLCLNVDNFAASTPTTTKATFTWTLPATTYSFARIKLRVDTVGSTWTTAGGFGVFYPAVTKNKNSLNPGTTYRASVRTWCDSAGGPYRSALWTAPIFWTQPTTIKLSSESLIQDLEIYPNPSRDIFNVSFTSVDKQDLRVRILNIIGEELINENLEQFIGEYTKQIDLSNNAKGIYFLEIETNDGIINKKLILQ